MRVALGNDHAGYVLREAVQEAVRALGDELVDFGTDRQESCDYPDIVIPVTRALVEGDCELGLLICGTGIGMAIAANKVPGIYAARCEEGYSARMAREHNAANVLTLGGRVIGPGLAAEVVTAFLTATPSCGPRHQVRQEKVRRLEAQRG